jgi:hypothetical protein
MEAVTGMHRKALTRLMNGSLERKPRSTGRGVTYGPQVDDALRVINESFDHLCAERVTPNLVWMATHLAAHGELDPSPTLLAQLACISRATVQRRLSRIRQDQPRLPRPPSRPRSKLLHDIPALRLSWQITQPGFFETDFVFHCGRAPAGEFVCTLQMIGVATGWSERRAVLGRSFLVVEDAFIFILLHLPFPVILLHPDNDSAFFNHHLLRFWRHRVKDVQLARNRPYHKNDNPRVEQKNASLVRHFLGDIRLDTVDQTRALNALYRKMGLYYNLFQPVMHLVGKEVTSQSGQRPRLKRIYDDARTPFDRLCQTDAILPHHRDQLAALRDSLNPRQLRQEIYDDLDQLFALPGAAPGERHDVRLTLANALTKGADDPYDLIFNRTPIRGGFTSHA